MVVIYRTGWVSYQIARRLVQLDNIALVNLVLGKRVVPELIQNDANPSRMYDELSQLLTDDQYRRNMQDQLATVPSLLGGLGASRRAAEAIGEYL